MGYSADILHNMGIQQRASGETWVVRSYKVRTRPTKWRCIKQWVMWRAPVSQTECSTGLHYSLTERKQREEGNHRGPPEMRRHTLVGRYTAQGQVDSLRGAIYIFIYFPRSKELFIVPSVDFKHRPISTAARTQQRVLLFPTLACSRNRRDGRKRNPFHLSWNRWVQLAVTRRFENLPLQTSQVGV